MKKAFFEDSAMAMAKLIVESIYHGMEENEGVYADLMYSNGKGQHGWAHILTKKTASIQAIPFTAMRQVPV